MIALIATIVFFGVWSFNFFVGFRYADVVLAVAAGVLAIALLVSGVTPFF